LGPISGAPQRFSRHRAVVGLFDPTVPPGLQKLIGSLGTSATIEKRKEMIGLAISTCRIWQIGNRRMRVGGQIGEQLNKGDVISH
jgi:hypothetical protein